MARNLPFAPELVRLAEEIIDGMKRAGEALYNGIHLRIEEDAQDWFAIMGGEQVSLKQFQCPMPSFISVSVSSASYDPYDLRGSR